MTKNKIKSGVFSVGALDPDRKLFDEIIPLPKGTSYNSYLVQGSNKIALIDTVDTTKTDTLIANLNGVKKIDYIVANHAEQDHSGSIPAILKIHPKAQVICTEKCKGMLIDMLEINEDKFIIVNDEDTISLGDKTLKFLTTPWVHWPETMTTYLVEDKILFPCDFLGAHVASNKFVKDEKSTYDLAKLYFAGIMMPFRIPIRKNLEKIKTLEIDIIAPSHGEIHGNPNFIIEAYEDWASDNTKKQVLIPYISMHGSTKILVEHVAKSLQKKGIIVNVFNLTESNIGELATSLVDSSGIIFASPAFLAGAHPGVANAAYLINILRPKTKFVSLLGSFEWGENMANQIFDMLKLVKAERIPPLIIKGVPKKQDNNKIDEFVKIIAEKCIGGK
jgi:flavorubredoxin